MKLQVQRSKLDTRKYFFQSTCRSALEQSVTKSCRGYFSHIVQETSRELYNIWALKALPVIPINVKVKVK